MLIIKVFYNGHFEWVSKIFIAVIVQWRLKASPLIAFITTVYLPKQEVLLYKHKINISGFVKNFVSVCSIRVFC